jgi:hypothetical protein
MLASGLLAPLYTEEKSASTSQLKGPKHEIFGFRFITPSKPIWVGDFRTERKNLVIARIWCIFGENRIKRMLIMRLMSLAHDERALNAFKRMLSILLMIFSACRACF